MLGTGGTAVNLASPSPRSDRSEWLAAIPAAVDVLCRRWSLTVGAPIATEEVSCAWVAFVNCRDGTSAVLKLGMPHMEGQDEIAGLRFWNGDAMVRLLDFDARLNAMLLERCEPGSSLRELPESEQDVIIAQLLQRLWRLVPDSGFRPLSEMIAFWTNEALSHESEWSDAALVREGIRVFDELIQSPTTHVLLATDLHAGNVLRAQREPWLAIDPKPFIGDPAYDATQHLLNCRARLRDDPSGTIVRYSDLLDVDAERVRRWTFARLAAEPRDNWRDVEMLELAQLLA